MSTTQAPPLWRQLQAAAAALQAVRAGQSATTALATVAPALRPAAQALLFHALRQLGRAEALRSLLAKRAPAPPVDALLCLALALVWDEANAPYTPFTLVDQAVEAARRGGARAQSGFVNACLRRFLREREALVATSARDPVAQWNHPRWWIARMQRDWPQDWQAVLRASDHAAPLTLRVNRRRSTVAAMQARLQAEGIAAQPIGDDGLLLPRPRPVPELPGYAEGAWSVQDAAAQLAAPLLLQGLARPTDRPLRLLDACAAPGGKTAHLLECADAELTALDVDPARCARIHENLARLGLAAEVRAADAADVAAWWDGRPFDAILLDAPCSASGIVRRHPDVRWLRRESDIAQLVVQQDRLLQALWPLVAPGGRLLFATCSVFPAEGRERIETFLAHHSEARLLPSPGHLIPCSAAAAPAVPDNRPRDNDGFFYSLLEKGPR
ncbi:ribosomal RNA small subunit methyltransferase B [Pseudorhodoferax aquiterrae]|uniref:16S rRNA (cytosine(967)-C(5))-methyltransferase n=1 Tax=Pseudorhodoferax aquiterrae TaxID=747304 RepID=A0ABQ3G3F6_9BURK|nr:16S rRNA (cytosine(967)-C(5))-methyltransferase RsmB [Pseudorhodoferax aquiterrae]GHC87361.1 ribosomal RNA small subunit methyltransferase B [Pseudorhodoferax aquiterrae]